MNTPNFSKQMDIPIIAPIYNDFLERFSKFQTKAQEEIYTRFKDIEKLKEFQSDEDPGIWKEKDFTGKFTGWLKESAMLLLRVFTLLWFPICWFIITRRGYDIGGVNVNDYPYRNPHINRKSFSNISKIYEQAGGAPFKFTIIGNYDSVESPYQILAEQDTSLPGRLKTWVVDSLATISALGRLILSMTLSVSSPLTGFDNSKDSNLFRFLLSIPIGYIMCPLILLGGMFLVMLLGMLIIILKVKDYWWPFVGSRTFSPVALIFIFIILGIFAPYASIIIILSFMFSLIFSTIHWFGIMLFVIGAPFIFISKKLRSGESEQISKMMKAIANGTFWIYMFMVLNGPTKIIWGDAAAMGGLIYLVYLAFTTRGQILKN